MFKQIKICLLLLPLLLLTSCDNFPWGSSDDGLYSDKDWICTVGINGENLSYLKQSSSSKQFTPDGSKIIVSHFGAIYSINIDGTNCKSLIEFGAWGLNDLPSISFDSKKITYATSRDIYIMDIDGLNVVNLTQVSHKGFRYPQFSPDGNQIIYVDDADSTMCIMDINGENKREIISGVRGISRPTMSLDGERIYYIHAGIYFINIDGTNNT